MAWSQSDAATNNKKRRIHVTFGDYLKEYELDNELNKCKWNDEMFTKFRNSIKRDFKINTEFLIYDETNDTYIYDINNLYSCYIGHEHNYDFIPSLQIQV